MQVIRLDENFTIQDYCDISNGVKSKDDPRLVKRIALIKTLRAAIAEDNLYVKYLSGDRAGTVAKLVLDPEYRNADDVSIYVRSFYEGNKYSLTGDSIFTITKFTGRSNKFKHTVGSRYDDVEYIIPDSPIETVYNLADNKAKKEKVLASTVFTDIDGVQLFKGDKVLYVNTRYGSGTELCHGFIKDFKISGSEGKFSTSVIVRNRDIDEVSEISNSAAYIYKTMGS